MTEYTLHGRPLKVGNQVWHVSRGWMILSHGGLVEEVENHPQYYSWNEVDLSKIEPPLFWMEGHPVNPGTPMLYRADDGEVYACVVEQACSTNRVYCQNARGYVFDMTTEALTFTIPKTRKVWASCHGTCHAYLYKTKELAERLEGKGYMVIEIEVPIYVQVNGDS